MGLQILDGSGTGRLAQVSSAGQIRVVSENQSLQHHVSKRRGLSFQVIGSHVNVAGAGTYSVLHIQNTSTTLSLVVSYMRIQSFLAGISTAGDYYSLGFDSTYTSGGSAVTPVNMNRSSGNLADATCRQSGAGDPIVTGGTFSEFDRWYIVGGATGGAAMMDFNKEGSLILGQNDTLDIRVIASQNGTHYARTTFMYIDLTE